MTARRIFLVGPMGAGKTTVGKRLARELGLRFVDCDALLEQRTGTSIALIFEIEGEAGFRERERQILAEVTRWPDVVVSTGGGAVLLEENRELLRARGTVIYLRTSVDEQLRRTRGSPHRPLLNTPDPRARLEALAAQRNPLYLAVADLVIDSDTRRVSATVQDILSRLEAPVHGTPASRTS